MGAPFNVFRGAIDDITESLQIQDGQLIFALDTKQIYLDYDVKDGVYDTPTRIKFGSSTGIWYGTKTDAGDAAQVMFSLSNLEEAIEYPSPKDLILNSDGSFFKVQEVDPNLDEIIALRLTVSGVGGGGGGSAGGTGYIEYRRVGAKKRYYSVQEDNMLLTFNARIDSEDSELGVDVYLIDAGGNRKNIGSVNNIGQSWDQDNPLTVDIKPFMEAYKYTKNSMYNIELTIFDDEGNESIKPIPYEVTIFDMYVSPYDEVLGTKKGGFSYYCIPTFYTALENVTLFYRVTNVNYSNVVQTNYPDRGVALGTSNSGQTYIYDVTGDISVGSYKIETWLWATLPGTNGNTTVESKHLEQTFIKQSSSSGDPILVVNYPSTSITYKQYETISIPYFVSYRESTIGVTRTVQYTDPEGKTTTEVDNLTQSTETNLTWEYRFMGLGSYKFIIQVGANQMNKQESKMYLINTASATIPTVTEGALVLNLVADKENDDIDRDTWISKTTSTEVECDLQGFNWISNGWRTINKETSLFLNNGAKVEIPFSPFTTAAESYGTTIEFDVNISNIRNRQSEIIKCISKDTDNVLHCGIIVNGDYFTLNSDTRKPIEDYLTNQYIELERAGMTATYVPGQRVRVSFVITPDGKKPYATMPSNMICTYVNGVLSGFVDYGNDTFKNFSNDASTVTADSHKIIFDSTDADIDIYNVRIYQTALTDRAVLGNYFASFGDFTEAANRWDDNQVLNDGELSLEYVMKKGNIPYMLFRGGASVTDKKGNELVLPINTGLPTAKDDYRLYDMCFIDPENPSKNIGTTATNGRKHVVLYAQGTSSMGYPIKNQRMIFARKNRKETYQLFDNLPGVDLFCLKADYMESSSAHNTGLGNALNDLYGDVKPPSRLYSHADGLDRVTAIVGRPIICFWKESALTPEELANTDENFQGYQFIGRYNFNLDKSTHTPFGFYSEYGDRYGVAVVDPPRLSSTYAADLATKTPIAKRIATIDETPDSNKTYYKSPDAGDEAVWTWTDIAEWDEDEEEFVWALKQPAYEEFYAPVSDEKFADLSESLKEYTGVISQEAYDQLTESQKARTGVNSIEVWECLDNNKVLTHFQSDWDETSDPNNAIWVENFESRYPKYEVQEMSDKRNLKRLINWLHETDCIYTKNVTSTNDKGEEVTSLEYYLRSNEPSYEDIIAGNIPDDLTPLFPSADNPRLPEIQSTNSQGIHTFKTQYNHCYDSYQYRLAKFKAEFDQYFESDLTLFYYLVTEMFLMTDSRAKNMMLCTFTGHCTDAEGKSVTKWFPIFYDMDTGLCVNNIGALKFVYKDEDYFENVYNAEAGYMNQNGTINKSYSTLWSNIRETMFEKLRTLYAKLRGGYFTPEYMISAYNDNQANAWNESYINQDAMLKYVNPYLQQKEQTGGDGVQINACQGTRSLHRYQYLNRRFLYMDSKYSYTADSANIEFRINDLQINPQDIFEFYLTTNDAMYLNTSFGNTGFPNRTERVDEHTTVKIRTREEPSGGQMGEQPYYMWIINNIVSLGDMSDMGIQLFSVKGDLTDVRMKELNLSTNRPGYEYELIYKNRMSSLDAVGSFPMLETLNVGYWNALASLDLRNNKNLKHLYATGTILSSCLFPEGGILETIELPATLKKFEIIGHYNLNSIKYRKYESIYNDKLDRNDVVQNLDKYIITPPTEAWEELIGLSIAQCPQVDTKYIFSRMKDTNITIKLPDINWVITPGVDDVKLNENNVIVEIPLLQKLVNQGGYDGEEARDSNGELIVSRAYVGGHITINNGSSIGVDEALLYEKYTKYYPYLQIHYTWNDENCIRAYSLNTYDANAALIVADSFKFTSETVSTEFTLEKVFGTPETGFKIDAIDKMPDNEYSYTFLGWNREGVLTFVERDYTESGDSVEQAINKAKAAAMEKVIVAWDGEKYSETDNFDFKTAFSETNQELGIYPTFLATVREWTATFTDGRGNIVETQKVRYGDYAVAPDKRAVNPVKPLYLIFDPSDPSVTMGYPFVRFGAKDEDYQMLTDETFEAVYEENPVDIHDARLVAPEGYFEFNSGILTLKDTYPISAICVPKTYQGSPVTEFRIPSVMQTFLTRVYFEPNNSITTIADHMFNLNNVDESQHSLLYYEFKNLNALDKIGQYAFRNNSKLIGSDLVKVRAIDGFAFQDCIALQLTQIPYNTEVIGQSAFRGCSSLRELSFECPNLTVISQNAFRNCTNLQIATQTLPRSLTEIGRQAFMGCDSLTIMFDQADSLEKICEQAFANAKNIRFGWHAPWSLKEIQKDAFAANSAAAGGAVEEMELVRFNENLETIGPGAFGHKTFINGMIELPCPNLKDWSSVDSTGISPTAFANIKGLHTIRVLRNAGYTVREDRWGATNPEAIQIEYE